VVCPWIAHRFKFDVIAMNVTAWSNVIKTMFKPGGAKGDGTTGEDYEGFHVSTNFWHLGLSGLTYFNTRKCFITYQYNLYKGNQGPWKGKAPSAFLEGIAAQANTSVDEIKTRYLLIAFDNENDSSGSDEDDDDCGDSGDEVQALEAQLVASKKMLHSKRKRIAKSDRDKQRLKRDLMKTRVQIQNLNGDDDKEVPETDFSEDGDDDEDGDRDDSDQQLGDRKDDDGQDGDDDSDREDERWDGFDGSPATVERDEDEGGPNTEGSFRSILPITNKPNTVTRQHGGKVKVKVKRTSSAPRKARVRKRFTDDGPSYDSKGDHDEESEDDGSGRSAGRGRGQSRPQAGEGHKFGSRRRAAETPEAAKRTRQTSGDTPVSNIGQGSRVCSQSRSLTYEDPPARTPPKLDLLAHRKAAAAIAAMRKNRNTPEAENVQRKKKKISKDTLQTNPGIEGDWRPGLGFVQPASTKKKRKKTTKTTKSGSRRNMAEEGDYGLV